MTSSTAGERRWASTKKGGMTVLGKVAVPKPINLPSQRLENHGLDPNVELVPKGSLSWGARSSSTGSNPWGSSSTLSPKTEGGSASPSHLTARPSSGGGTRPSTAGSEKNPDSTSSGWTSNSRPSSASGVLASNNTPLMASRPQSADTRPGSSQLSRFAEPLGECTAAQSASSTAYKLGTAASSNDGFSLSSGDFPTLGSEKSSGKNTESTGHKHNGRPGSSSGVPTATTEKREAVSCDDASRAMDAKNGMVNSWNNDAPQHIEDGSHPGMERWHGDPYSYPNPNIFPHPYENWRGGAPLNPPNGVWFRGPPGTPYGAPPMTATGGFPMEPFPYYRPQVPAPGLVNSQAIPPHSAGPRGPHSKSGDFGRPFTEPYIRPGMPIRPGFYPGYYGPPMGFWNPNERDLTSMGVPAGGPPAYNRFPNQNVPEPTNSSVSSEGKTLEQVEHGPPNDSHRHYSVPVKQIKCRDRKSEEDLWGHKVRANPQTHDKGNLVNSSSQQSSWSEDHRKDEHVKHRKVSLHSEEASSVLHEDKIDAKDPAYVNFHGSSSSGESADVHFVVENVALPRNHRLINKVEGLKATDVASHRRHDDARREEPHGRGHVVSSKACHRIEEANVGVNLEKHYPSGILVPVSRNMAMVTEDKGFGSTVDSVTAISRHSSHNVQARDDTCGKGRFNSQRADGWRVKGAASVSPGMVLVVNSERITNHQGKEQPTEMQSTEMPRSEEEIMDDSSDDQRSKMREIAKQRALKLQKEEEERIKEQKAKAFAKLEELNRRTANQGKETRDKEENVPNHADVIQKQGESNIKIELRFGSIQSGELGSTSSQGCNPSKDSKALESNTASGAIFLHTIQHMHQGDPVIAQQRLPATDDARVNKVAATQNIQVGQISRQKRVDCKQDDIDLTGNKLTEKPIRDAKEKSNTNLTVLQEGGGKGYPSLPESNAPVVLPTASESLLQPKRKNNRAGKNKHKVDESFAVSSSSVLKEDAFKSVTESSKLNTIESKHEDVKSSEVQQSSSRDDVQHRGNNSWKPQHVKNMQRNSQARSIEKFHGNDAAVWAPVKPRNKIELTDDSDQKAKDVTSPTRSVSATQSSSKGKRAEMERYVPKAAIKESAQQGSSQQSASPSTEMSIREQASSQSIKSTGRRVESRHAGSKPKLSDDSWQQRDSAESNSVQISGDKPSSMTNHTKNSRTLLQQTQKPEELRKGSAAKPVADLVKAQSAKQDEQPAKQQSHAGEINQEIVVDGWNIFPEPVSSSVVSGPKDHGALGRGKRNQFKDQRGSRNLQNFEHKNNSYTRAYPDYSETCQPDRPNSSKGKNVAQWQPKSPSHVTNQQGSSAWEQQTVTSEAEKILDRESKDRESQESFVERKAAPSKDRAHSSNKNTVVEVEIGPVTEQRPSSSGHLKNGAYNGRFNRGLESRGDRSFIAQDNRNNYAPTNREKLRQNSHYEYRPVGPHNTNKRGQNSEGQNENQHASPRFRDLGPVSHSRRGGTSFSGQ